MDIEKGFLAFPTRDTEIDRHVVEQQALSVTETPVSDNPATVTVFSPKEYLLIVLKIIG